MLSLSLVLALCPPAAWAGFAPTASARSGADADLEKVRAILESKKVAGALAGMGYAQAEIEARLAGLSQREISDLAGRLDGALTPAGNPALAVGVVAACVLVIIGVTYLIGALSYPIRG
jgi:hypothetical protein